MDTNLGTFWILDPWRYTFACLQAFENSVYGNVIIRQFCHIGLVGLLLLQICKTVYIYRYHGKKSVFVIHNAVHMRMPFPMDSG